jgi:Fe-S-cluster containining protein
MAKSQKKRVSRPGKLSAKRKPSSRSPVPDAKPLPRKELPVVRPTPIAVPIPIPNPAKSISPPQEGLKMCQGCQAACCDLRVDLTPFDIARIVHQENRNPNEFVELFQAQNNDSFGFRTKFGLVKMILRRDAGTCVFKSSGDLKCVIEKSKPAVCLVYPFSVNYGIPYIRRDVICPKENRDRADRSKMSLQTINDSGWEARRYEETIFLWNKHAKGTEDLSRFLAFAATELDADRSPISGLKKNLGRFMLRIGLR